MLKTYGRPKGYRINVWNAILKEVQRDKTWALNTLKTDLKWINKASDVSIQMVGALISQSDTDLAKTRYDYLKHRATCGFDRHAQNDWNEKLKGVS